MFCGGKNNARIINVLQAIAAELGGGGGGKPAFKKNAIWAIYFLKKGIYKGARRAGSASGWFFSPVAGERGR